LQINLVSERDEAATSSRHKVGNTMQMSDGSRLAAAVIIFLQPHPSACLVGTSRKREADTLASELG